MWVINRTIFLGHKAPHSLWMMSLDLKVRLVAALKLWITREVILSIKFPIPASSLICICPIWCICMTPDQPFFVRRISVWTCPRGAPSRKLAIFQKCFSLFGTLRVNVLISDSNDHDWAMSWVESRAKPYQCLQLFTQVFIVMYLFMYTYGTCIYTNICTYAYRDINIYIHIFIYLYYIYLKKASDDSGRSSTCSGQLHIKYVEQVPTGQKHVAGSSYPCARAGQCSPLGLGEIGHLPANHGHDSRDMRKQICA